MTPAVIDVWHLETFDADLLADLADHQTMIHDYFITARRHYIEREGSDHTKPYPENPFGSDFMVFSDYVGSSMTTRTIRAWHYTRLCDDEVESLLRHGIQLSTLDTLRHRLDKRVASGEFGESVATALYVASPFHSEQLDGRRDKFWMVSHPVTPDDGGVELLLESWGGEAVYFWQQDRDLQAMLKSIGTPRVVELTVPLALTRHASLAGRAVIATFARTLGCTPDKCAFDLYAAAPLAPNHIRKIHSPGTPSFTNMARSYPATFVDSDIGRWGDFGLLH